MTVLSQLHVVRSNDLDEATAEVERIFYPSQLRTWGAGFGMQVTVAQLASIMAGVVHFDSRTQFSVEGLDVAYHVNVGLDGAVESRCGSSRMTADPATAALFRPVGDSAIRGWERGGERMLTLKIERATLENHLRLLAGREIRGYIQLEPSLDLRSGLGAQWMAMAQAVVTAIEQGTPGAPLLHPALAVRLSDAMMTGLLLAADHQHRDLLHRPAAAARPASIQRAVDLIHDQPHELWTLTDLASRVGVSARSLQEGFARHVGASPMRYLTQVRLDRAHRQLQVSNPDDITASTVASSWGFTNYGRFAEAYRRRFGTSPAATLRG